MFRKILLMLALTLLTAACTVQSDPVENGQKNSPTKVTTQADGVSNLDDLINQLRASGAVVEPAGPVEQVFFSVPGQFLLINGQEVQVFEYANEEARLAESDQISKDGSSIGTTMVTWIDTPHFWADGRLVTLYVGNNQEVVVLMSQVMGQAITQP